MPRRDLGDGEKHTRNSPRKNPFLAFLCLSFSLFLSMCVEYLNVFKKEAMGMATGTP
jgi:hypothetical protein